MNVILSFLLAASLSGWRTDGTGRYPTATPPTTWSSTQQVVWATALTNWSNASPVLTGDRLFVCAEPTVLLCVRATDGTVLWQRSHAYPEAFPAEAANIEAMQRQAEPVLAAVRAAEKTLREIRKKRQAATNDVDLARQEEDAAARIGELKESLAAFDQWRRPATHGVNGFSSCTPVTDGQRVWVLFGNGIAASYDLDGTRRWVKLVDKPTAGWGQSSSPTLAGGQLIILINALHALDPRTGEERWRVPAQQRWGSPVATRVGDTEVIVTPGGDVVRARDGKVLVTGLTSLEYNTPLVQDNVVYFIQHGGTAVKLVPDGDGVRAQPLWTTEPKKERYYASPLFHDGLIYAINQYAEFSVLDAQTGAVVHQRKLPLTGTVYPSITLAGGYLFIGSEGGTTVVLEPGREPREVARNLLGKYRASPVFQGRRLFIRTLDTLYCIGQ